jgi:hypothetical protein
MLDAKEKVKLVQSKRGHLHARNLPDPTAVAS